MKTIYIALCLFFLFMIPASYTFGKVDDVAEIMAEGVSSMQDTAMARDQALRDAQRRAVEKGVGVYIDAETQLQNLQVIEDNILATSQGYLLPDYKILSEGMESDGLYHLVLSARVRLGKLSDDLETLEELHKIGLIKKAGNPRTMILISQEEHGKTTSSEFAVAKLSEILSSHGLEVVTGEENGCEILIEGNIVVNKGGPLKIGVVTVSPVTAELEIQGILTGNSNVMFGRVIKSNSANTAAEAVTNACEKAGKYVANSILQNVISDINKIELQLRGMNYKDFEKFTDQVNTFYLLM